MLKRSEVDKDDKDTVSSGPTEASGAAQKDPATAGDSGADKTDSAHSEVDSLHQQLAEKDKELAELKDKYLRVLADAENSRKRIRQQSEESVRVQRENFLRDLLPIVDNLERAVEAARGGTQDQPIVEGV